MIREIGASEDSKNDDCCESACPTSARRKVDAATKQAGAGAVGTAGCSADDEANAAECHGSHAAACSVENAKWSPSRSAQVQIPEIGHAEIAGEWLIPHDEFLVVAFGPHTVADKDGKAVVRERLALVSAEEVALPTASTSRGYPGTAPTAATGRRQPAAPSGNPRASQPVVASGSPLRWHARRTAPVARR